MKTDFRFEMEVEVNSEMAYWWVVDEVAQVDATEEHLGGKNL